MTTPHEIGPTEQRAGPSTVRLLLLQVLALVIVGGVTLLDTHIFWNPVLYHSGDVWEYYRTATGLLHGGLPYRDFPLEYPPLAVLPFLVPLIFAGGHAISFTLYCWLLLAENILLSAAFTLTLAATARRFRPGGNDALTWCVSGIILLSPLLPWRYDLFPALLTLFALRSVLHRRPGAAGIWLGFGVAAKIYPVVFLPVLFAYHWVQKDRRAAGHVAAGCLAAVAMSFLPFAAAGPKLWSFLQYHQHRGVEMESLAAGWVFLAHLFWRIPVMVVFNYGAFHLVSPLSPALLKIIPWSAGLLLGLTMLWSWKQLRADAVQTGAVRPGTLLLSLTAMLLAFVVTNKVFSPQYLIWFLPLAPLLASRHRPLFGAVCLLTIALFPFAFPALTAGAPGAVGLLLLRNLLAVVLLARLLLPSSSRRVALSSPAAVLPIIQDKKASDEHHDSPPTFQQRRHPRTSLPGGRRRRADAE